MSATTTVWSSSAADRRTLAGNACRFPVTEAEHLRRQYRKMRRHGIDAYTARRIIWSAMWVGMRGQFVSGSVRAMAS